MQQSSNGRLGCKWTSFFYTLLKCYSSTTQSTGAISVLFAVKLLASQLHNYYYDTNSAGECSIVGKLLFGTDSKIRFNLESGICATSYD